MPTRGQDRREEIGKENNYRQLAFEIRERRSGLYR